MKLHARFAWFIASMLIIPTSDSMAAGDAKRGKELYQVCVTCHGEDARGNPDFQAPQLAGQYGWYLIRQLENFRNGLRGVDPGDVNGIVMKPMAEALQTPQDIEDVVAYIITKRPERHQ